MADYRTKFSEFESLGLAVVAASADTAADAGKAWAEGGSGPPPFPVGHSLDPQAVAESHGLFFNPGRPNLHAAGFLLKPGGEIVDAVYSTGSIGRLNPADALRVLGNVKKREGYSGSQQSSTGR